MEEVRPDMELSPEEQAEMQDRLVAMAECMRERGHDMPDPQVDGDGGVRITRGGPASGSGGDGAGGGPPGRGVRAGHGGVQRGGRHG